MVKPLTISLDLDSVLADTMRAYCKLYNREYKDKGSKTFVTKDQIKSWDLKNTFPLLKDTYTFFVYVWRDWGFLPTTENDIDLDTQALIDQGHTVMILTSQQKETMPFILEWLKAQNIPHDYLCFVPHMKDKVKFPADIYIDDYPYLAQYLPDGKKQLLYTQPWNVDVPESEKVTRINSLDDAIEILGR